MALTPYDEARAFVLAGCPPLAPVAMAIADSRGCVLAEPIVAGEAIPPFANSAMDGFAVQAGDTAGASDDAPAVLRLVGTVRAGEAPTVAVGPGEALRIMTGAPVPDGADAVVMVERTKAAADDATVAVFAEIEPGTSVRVAGDDIAVGQAVFPVGEVITPGHIGVLASLGITEVQAHPRPRVGVFSTGDELVQGGGPLAPGQIRDSNRITLLALVAESGFDGVDLGCLADDEGAISEALHRAGHDCDALLTTGGVSMGDFDFVKVVLDRIGEMRWMQVAIKPSKPLAFGTIAGGGAGGDVVPRVPVFGLPGNPVSSTVSFELFARPGLRRMMGHGEHELDRPHVVAVADETLRRRPDGKTHFNRVVARYVDGVYRVASAGGQGSHQLSAMAVANALAVLPDGESVEAGSEVEIIVLDGARR
jgi:molybdenum cofactor synthesis domain-containing protein